MTQEDSEAVRARSLVHGQVCYLQIPAADTSRSATIIDPAGNPIGLAGHTHPG